MRHGDEQRAPPKPLGKVRREKFARGAVQFEGVHPRGVIRGGESTSGAASRGGRRGRVGDDGVGVAAHVVDAGDGQSGERVVAAVRTRGRSRVDAYGSVDDGDVAERERGARGVLGGEGGEESGGAVARGRAGEATQGAAAL